MKSPKPSLTSPVAEGNTDDIPRNGNNTTPSGNICALPNNIAVNI